MGDVSYEQFVAQKLRRPPATGLAQVPELHERLFPFQRALVGWALKRGRAAIFADTGLGKTSMQLEWARHVAGHTDERVLILAPLAVAAQTVREGKEIGLDVTLCRDGADLGHGVNITNYDRLHRFAPDGLAGIVLDESSIIKHHDAKTLGLLLEFSREIPFRLAATATPAPNDFAELGTHAEWLGVCTRQEMLSEFFVHDGGETQVWRLKGHARGEFWRWVASWGALLRRPSDLGFSDQGYDLPPLEVEQHTIAADMATAHRAGMLFVHEASSLTERRAAKRASIEDRVAACAAIVNGHREGCQCERVNSASAPLNERPTRSRGSSKSDAAADAAAPSSSSGLDSQSGPTKKGARDDSNTTARTTRATEESGGDLGPSKIASTLPGEKNTEPTPCSESSTRLSSGRAIRSPSETVASGQRSASGPTNTTDFSESRGVAVRSVIAPSRQTPTLEQTSGGDSTLTTAIGPASSGGCSVPHATSVSESSPTSQTDSKGPPNTCDANERWIVWCDLNAEQDALEAAFGDECISIYGSLDADEKESRLNRFIAGEGRILLGKVSIFGFGINLQSVCRMAFVGVTDSWESYYQAVRRCWRFGQKRPVKVHLFASEAEGAVAKNLARKEADAKTLAEQLSQETRAAVEAEVRGSERESNPYEPIRPMEVPSWLRAS